MSSKGFNRLEIGLLQNIKNLTIGELNQKIFDMELKNEFTKYYYNKLLDELLLRMRNGDVE